MASTAEYKCKNDGCGKMFTARTADRKRGWALFCSKRCKAVEQEKRTGQHAAYQARRDAAHASTFDSDWEVAMADNEAGWDGHKNAF